MGRTSPSHEPSAEIVVEPRVTLAVSGPEPDFMGMFEG
jgi:hypothetical protein